MNKRRNTIIAVVAILVVGGFAISATGFDPVEIFMQMHGY